MKLSQNISKATNEVLNGLGESIYTKFVHCKYAKEIWDKLQLMVYDEKVLMEGKLYDCRR
jgi:hypothetical protein